MKMYGKSNKRLYYFTAAVFILFFSGTNYEPPDIDHAKVIRSLNASTLEKGKKIYASSCIGCHGADGTASLPQARSFSKDKLRFGNKPYDMWKTISFGAGMMAAQTWLNPAERYYVIQYIREEFMKKSNPRQYYKITNDYLSRLPKSQKSIDEQLAETKREALKGSLKYGQEWFMHNQSDYGYAIHSQLKDHSTSVLTVLLDHNVLLSYSLLRMGTVAAWKGRLNVSDTKYNRYRGEGEPFIEGKEMEGMKTWQWSYNGQFDSLNLVTGVRTPLPKNFFDYHGHYRHGKKTILSYSINGREILEYPEAQLVNKSIVLSHTLKIGAGAELKLFTGQLKNIGSNITAGSDKGNIYFIYDTSGKAFNRYMATGVTGAGNQLRWSVDEKNRIILSIPASNNDITLNIIRNSDSGRASLQAFTDYVQKVSNETTLVNIDELVKGGPAWWTKKITVRGKLAEAKAHFDPKFFEDEDKTAPGKLVKIPTDYPYTVDNIELPFNNPYNSWIRPSTLGFLSDGRLILGTYTGDIWMASGIDSALKNVTWQRIATGLYEPMGMKVINDGVYVTNRNGITILRDLNGDGETDFYENFHSDHDVSAFFHAFNFGLETDSKGNIYYVKPGEYTNNKDPGNVIRVSPDGRKWESLATGFRVNNGITITPDDKIFVSDNQGNWTPANKINYIREGKYYGYVPNITEPGWSPDGRKFSNEEMTDEVINEDIVPIPDTFEPPALWMPQEFDNSPGGGVWSDRSWGPFGDQFIHTSYGTGWVYHFHPYEVDGVMQGAMVAMPFQFNAGIQRAAVNPADRQIYVTGLTGWDDGVSTKYGILSRIRYKGGSGHLLKSAQVTSDGIELKFNFSLDPSVTDTSFYDVSQWNYKWTHNYGSAHYSVKNPGKEKEDKVQIGHIRLSEDGTSVILNIPSLQPVQTMRIRFKVKAKDGITVKDAVYLTINKIPG